MTKDGQPLAGPPKRSLADRITRVTDGDDHGDNNYGRLKNDHRDPFVSDFSEPARKASRGLADRITRDDGPGINIRGRGGAQEGINIRGSAKANGGAATEGINIRGVASGA